MAFSKQSINIDPTAETERILQFMRQSVRQALHRQGGVVGISGGVDSSVVLALCLRAFGGEKVTALILPEKDSDPESEQLGCLVANHSGSSPCWKILPLSWMDSAAIPAGTNRSAGSSPSTMLPGVILRKSSCRKICWKKTR